MLVDGGKSFPAAWSMAAKPCDWCKSAAALLFCRDHSAFMCAGCDAKTHDEPDRVAARHGRVWMCEVCEQAPASVTCKADAAALCVACDRDIHSANPLARRHERVPVVPFYESAEAVVKSTAAAGFLIPAAAADPVAVKIDQDHSCVVADEEVTASWIDLTNCGAKHSLETADHMKSIDLFFADSDQFLDFDYQMSTNTRFQHEHDSVVPVQNFKSDHRPSQILDHSPETRFEIDFTQSKLTSYNSYNTHQSLSHSVSSSSDVGVVPDGNSISEMSHSFALNMNGTMDLSGSENATMASQATQLTGLDRVARVMRYREKRKNRKFEKTIRYASRKAYAEARPRIKGRFVKRTEIETDEVDRYFHSGSSTFMAETGYGVVPSF